MRAWYGVALLLLPAQALAVPVETQRGTVQRTVAATGVTTRVGLAIDDGGLDAAVYTGWLHVSKFRAIAFAIDFTGDGTATGVTMTCQTSNSTSTANGSGRDMHSLSISAGTATSSVLTWSYTQGSDAAWTWTVDNIPDEFLNCAFDALASGQSDDTIDVTVRGISP